MSEQEPQDTPDIPDSEGKYTVKKVCSWCNGYMGLADWKDDKPGIITHAMCEECRKKTFKDFGVAD